MPHNIPERPLLITESKLLIIPTKYPKYIGDNTALAVGSTMLIFSVAYWFIISKLIIILLIISDT